MSEEFKNLVDNWDLVNDYCPACGLYVKDNFSDKAVHLVKIHKFLTEGDLSVRRGEPRE